MLTIEQCVEWEEEIGGVLYRFGAERGEDGQWHFFRREPWPGSYYDKIEPTEELIKKADQLAREVSQA